MALSGLKQITLEDLVALAQTIEKEPVWHDFNKLKTKLYEQVKLFLSIDANRMSLSHNFEKICKHPVLKQAFVDNGAQMLVEERQKK